jgi:hypothetical protein
MADPRTTTSDPPERSRIPGPTFAPWREQALTRAAELRSRLCELCSERTDLTAEIERHIAAAEEAAAGVWPDHRGLRWPRRIAASMRGAGVERADSELDAAEAALLRIAPPSYVIGQLPAILTRARIHLPASDPRLQRLTRLAQIYADYAPAADPAGTAGNGHRPPGTDGERA